MSGGIEVGDLISIRLRGETCYREGEFEGSMNMAGVWMIGLREGSHVEWHPAADVALLARDDIGEDEPDDGGGLPLPVSEERAKGGEAVN